MVVADRFRLVRPLGQGGMGAVWLAQHTGLDVPCAVKFIHEEAAKSAEIRARFEREAKAAAQLRSPHVVQILDHGVWQGAPYIAMELLEGEDLDHRLRSRRMLSPRETLTLAMQVGRALTKAHGAGLVHRDLKPANIFLVRDDEREIAKVLDFGVAKINETGVDGSTKTGAVLGTPFYMSPEQARGSKTIDHRSDLWALAVVVYQCLTGRLPFVGEALGDLFVKIIIEPLPVPSQFAPVPPGFDAWWARAAARDPAQRFQTAKDFTDTLGLALGVTVAAGVEVGSPMASPGGPGPMGSGTVAMASSGPVTPYQNGQPTPQPNGQPTPYPGAPTPRPVGQPMPYPSPAAAPLHGAMPPAMDSAISVHQAPRSGRGGLWLGVLAAVALLGGGGALLAFRSIPRAGSQPSDATARPTAPVSAAASSTTPIPTVTVSPTVAVAPPSASSSAVTEPSAAPVVVGASVPGRISPRPPPATGTAAAKPPPATGGKPKTDFGF